MTNNTNGNNEDLFSQPQRNRYGFTEAELLAILQFAEANDLDGAAKAKLIARFRDVRAAQAKRRRKSGSKSKGS